MNPLKQKLIAMREELKSIADSGDDQAAVAAACGAASRNRCCDTAHR
jgi:hypothetical protein